MGLPQHGLIRRAPDCQRRGATVAVLSDLSNGKSRATCPSPFGPEATAIPDSARPNVGRPGRLCPSRFSLPEMPSLSKWLWQIEPRRPAMARAAGPADGRRIDTQFFGVLNAHAARRG